MSPAKSLDDLQKNKDPTLNEVNLPEPPTFSHDQFILFGDSITHGDGNPALGFSCVKSLQRDYSRRIVLVNRGFNGYNTVNAVTILPRIIPEPEQGCVRLVSFFFGANDISLPNTTGQHVPLHVFKENLRRLITHPRIQAHDSIRLLLITPAPIDEWGLDHFDEPVKSARTAVTAQQYAEAAKEVGEEKSVAVVDLWGACMKDAMAGWNASHQTESGAQSLLPGDKRAKRSNVLARLLHDGVHLSGDGYRILYQEIKKTIIDAYSELRPSNITVAFKPSRPEGIKDNAPW